MLCHFMSSGCGRGIGGIGAFACRAAEQRKADEEAKRMGPIDYDAPPPPLFPAAGTAGKGEGGRLQGVAEKVGWAEKRGG